MSDDDRTIEILTSPNDLRIMLSWYGCVKSEGLEEPEDEAVAEGLRDQLEDL